MASCERRREAVRADVTSSPTQTFGDAATALDRSSRDAAGVSGPQSPDAEDPFATATPVSAKSVGHTSYVLKLRLEGGLTAAYKPQSTLPQGDRRYKGEIAAYRLARALGLDNVPRAIPRAFPSRTLRQAFASQEGAVQFDKRALVDGGRTVRGALIPWISDYRVVPLEQPVWRQKWEPWLTRQDVTIPDDERNLAAEISTMIAFDFVTANWDRWSGGNIAQSGDKGPLLFVDNDGAFYENPGRSALAAQLALLKRIVRFSRSFVTALQAMDESKLKAALGEDGTGEPLLSDRVVAGVEARRASLLEVVQLRIAQQGESATLGLE